MSDNRKHPRRHLFYYLEILDPESGKLVGRLGDLSRVGLLLLSETGDNLPEKTVLRIVLPEDMDKPYLDLEVELRWKKPDTNPKLTAAGYLFKPLDYHEMDLLYSLIEFYGFNDGLGRFEI